MGNALQGTIAALDKGLIGGNPLESKFAAIDKGIKDVQDWKANIDKQRLDLKKTTAKSIREAEKYAAENMPSNDTAAAKMVESLAKFKEDAFISEKLVRNGNVPTEENLIFQENGKQTFEILSDFQNVSVQPEKCICSVYFGLSHFSKESSKREPIHSA